MRISLASLTTALSATALLLGAARPAHACGGFFCDSPAAGQPPMPVDQTGETIVFAFDEGSVEAHIQIQYTGDPEKFAWLIPLQSVPEVTVGSERLFLNLLNGTVPTLMVTPSFDFCTSGDERSGGPGCGFASSSDEASSPRSAGAGGSGGAGNVPPLVERRESVGAFEVTILSGSSTTIEQWLVTNGYLPDDEAPEIVDDYASRGYVFAAVKLQAGAGLDELHPLVIKYAGNQPCIPLKLTRIAAKEDMAVRAFFLGRRRSVPVGYRHVTLNQARLDWSATTLGANYTTLVSNAVDAPGASGQAFVTEYAGPTAVVSSDGISSPAWNANAFTALSPFDVVRELERQGLMSCSSATACSATHAQVLPLLRNHLPPPAGTSEAAFWACTSCYSAQVDPTTFDGVAFAAEMNERIIQPGLHASDLLRTRSYLTRLFTTISPAEMTQDPEFVELPADKPQSDVVPQLSATDRTTCDNKRVMNLSDGREVAYSGTSWPGFDNDMPWAERVEEFSPEGDRVELANFGDAIDDALTASNAAQGYDPASADRENLSQTSGGGACACGVRAPPAHGVGLLILGALGVLRRTGSRRGREA
jgi:hypothetical protein